MEENGILSSFIVLYSGNSETRPNRPADVIGQLEIHMLIYRGQIGFMLVDGQLSQSFEAEDACWQMVNSSIEH
ncbi:hypothetical protein [uncultured Methanolobus sp.]|uniref:hypothetical protein n=1 Tax=uncultured Methanolobus sp. TaxID=218300 RepID=UPI00374A304A